MLKSDEGITSRRTDERCPKDEGLEGIATYFRIRDVYRLEISCCVRDALRWREAILALF